jgi:1,4-alpha-glucan branching enzyme
MKWDMGWMHDTLSYLARDPVHRKHHQNELSFRGMYAFSENYVLPLSHDEAVHGKGSIYARMAGDEWQKLANLRLLLGYMYAQPGKKLLFMGTEFGQREEWHHDGQLDWRLLDDDGHRGISRWVGDLNRAYRSLRPLHELDCEPAGFSWIDASDAANSVMSFARHDRDGGVVVAVLNFTPVPRAVEQRRGDLRRRRTGQHGRGSVRPRRGARLPPVGEPDAAAAGHAAARARRRAMTGGPGGVVRPPATSSRFVPFARITKSVVTAPGGAGRSGV